MHHTYTVQKSGIVYLILTLQNSTLYKNLSLEQQDVS